MPTLRCGDEDTRRFVLDNLDKLVVKPANESGGSGVVVGTQASKAQLEDVAGQINHAPSRWVAQPVIPLSTAPTLCEGTVAPRHVDLRPFTLLGPEGAYVTRGGLTRVARRRGSLVVNSSQGGGSKDTWVVDTSDAAHATLATRRTSSRPDRGRPDRPPDGDRDRERRDRDGPGRSTDPVAGREPHPDTDPGAHRGACSTCTTR